MATTHNRDQRERWLVRNTRNTNLCIGDLGQVPTIAPGTTVDLLMFTTKARISQSKELKSMMDAGWLRLIKEKDNNKTSISKQRAKAAVLPVEENELDNYYTKSEVYTKTEADNTTAAQLDEIYRLHETWDF